MPSNAHDLIRQLRAVRRGQRVTQDKLARLSGYNRGCISDMECFRNDPRLDKLADVAEALGYRLELRKFAEK